MTAMSNIKIAKKLPVVMLLMAFLGIGVAASGVEYFDEPALVLMLASLPRGRFEVFSGAQPIRRIEPYAALVHADAATPDLAELIAEMSDRTTSGYLFGGVAAFLYDRKFPGDTQGSAT